MSQDEHLVSPQRIYEDFGHLLHALEKDQDKLPAEVVLLLAKLKQDLYQTQPVARATATITAPQPVRDNVSTLSHEINLFLQSSVGDQQEMSHEISNFLKSVEKALSQSSDFALYESYVARKQAQEPPAVPYYIPLNSPESKNALQQRYTSLPRKRKDISASRDRGHGHHHRVYYLIGGLAMIGCCLALGYRLVERYRTGPNITATMQHPPHTQPLPTPRSNAAREPGNHMPDPKVPIATTTVPATELEKILANERLSNEELFSLLKQCRQNRVCKAADIAVLGKLYERYEAYPPICALIVLIMQQIGGRAVEEWIGHWAQERRDNQLAVAEQLALYGEEAKPLIVFLLQKEANPQSSMKLVRILVPRYAEDVQVSDALISKFQQVTDHNLQTTILTVLATMNKVDPAFFVSVIATEKYGLTLRLNALDTVLFYANTQKTAANHMVYLVCELNEVAAATDDELLRRKSLDVIQQLVGK